MTGHLASDTAAANIRLIRRNRGWSPADLSAKCAELGDQISPAMIENIEHGRKRNGERTRDITVDELIAIADALLVSPGLLLPELISNYEFGDQADKDVYLETIIGNLEVAKTYLERRRSHRTSRIVDPILPIPVGDKTEIRVQVRDMAIREVTGPDDES